MARADFVFFGEVVSEFGSRKPHLASDLGWNFDVAAVWKGPEGRTAQIYSHDEDNSISSCDSEFDVGVIYVVFAYLDRDASSTRYRVGRCSLTMPVTKGEPTATAIVGELGEPASRPAR